MRQVLITRDALGGLTLSDMKTCFTGSLFANGSIVGKVTYDGKSTGSFLLEALEDEAAFGPGACPLKLDPAAPGVKEGLEQDSSDDQTSTESDRDEVALTTEIVDAEDKELPPAYPEQGLWRLAVRPWTFHAGHESGAPKFGCGRAWSEGYVAQAAWPASVRPRCAGCFKD